MSSPFQQRFSKKNPFGKNPKLNSVDTESSLPEAQFAGDDIESYDPKGAVVAERLKENYPESVDIKKKTQVSDGSVAKMASPLNAYVSTAGHFQRMQDKIASAFTPTRGNKADYDATEENKEYLEAEEQAAASKVITGDGFGNRSVSKPIAIEDIDVYDESDLEFDNY